MKIKPFEKFDLIKVYPGTSSIVDLWDYSLLQNCNFLKRLSRNFSYGMYLDKNLDIVKAYPDNDGRIIFDKFEIKTYLTKDRQQFFNSILDLYVMLKTLCKRFTRDRHRAAYKLIKACHDKENVLLQCWEWSEDHTVEDSNRNQQITLNIKACYSMFVLVE